mgnify:FL=1
MLRGSGGGGLPVEKAAAEENENADACGDLRFPACDAWVVRSSEPVSLASAQAAPARGHRVGEQLAWRAGVASRRAEEGVRGVA